MSDSAGTAEQSTEPHARRDHRAPDIGPRSDQRRTRCRRPCDRVCRARWSSERRSADPRTTNLAWRRDDHHRGADDPYESTGRTQQKARTRQALVTAPRQLLAEGLTPTVESAAHTARISRTTAYRYFTNQRQLLAATFPEIERDSLLGPNAPDDIAARLDLVIGEQIRILREWEPRLRAALRLSLGTVPDSEQRPQPVMRGGRAINWIRDALAPLAHTHPSVDRDRLAMTIRATCGIEAMVWTDVAGLPHAAAAALMRSSAQALLAAATS